MSGTEGDRSAREAELGRLDRAIEGLEDIARGGSGITGEDDLVGSEGVGPGSTAARFARAGDLSFTVRTSAYGKPWVYMVEDVPGVRIAPADDVSYRVVRGPAAEGAVPAEEPSSGAETITGSEKLARIARGETETLRALSDGRDEFWANFDAMLETLPKLSDEERAELLSRPRSSGRG
jgi:hypothetical protein